MSTVLGWPGLAERTAGAWQARAFNGQIIGPIVQLLDQSNQLQQVV